MNATPAETAKDQGFILHPETLEDYLHNVRFQLDNVDGYLQWARDEGDNDFEAARIKSQCLLEAATTLLCALERASSQNYSNHD